MLRLTRIEEGACYVSDATNLYIAWSMLYHSSKLFWGCETIKKLDQTKSLFDRFIEQHEGAAWSELMELYQSIESPVLDAIRIIICFENYFKARLLLEGYVIHQMDLNVCREHYPQFVTGRVRQRLLQETTPISIDEVKRAEKHEGYSVVPLRTLTSRTIRMGILCRKPKYRVVYSKDRTPDDGELFSALQRLNESRNTLHFLNVEYIAGGGMRPDQFMFLRDYVSGHIDDLGNRIRSESESELEYGEKEVHKYLPGYEGMPFDDWRSGSEF
jgi:hypothetical protein